MPELSKAYDPSQVEDRWYGRWIEAGCFTADPKRAFNGFGLTEEQKAAERAKGLKEAYSIVIPPPNVTGVLTMGHVLNNTIQDILCRRKRMQGFEVLWLPGVDHAGIATQSAVERQLRKEEKKTRHDFGREEFLKRVWAWKDKHGGIILQQLKKLGCSCDWSRTVFTMDGLDPRDPNPRVNYSEWVAHVFVRLHAKGLIHRGRRMVNWCVVSRTALSDEEVIMKESKGSLWHLRYPLLSETGEKTGQFLVVATTRPETMLGDTAVAVHPEDERYRHLVGRKVELPLTGRRIPIIADAVVDPKFGTGCVKVTPAHDPADFEMGRRHQLEQIQVIGWDGRMTREAGTAYQGLDRHECREKVVLDLDAQELVEKIEDYTHNVGYSERANVPVEPLVSEQWFFTYPAVEPSLQAVMTRETAFWPERWSKVYEHWMTNLRDWCISRQLWWGHRIPVWTRETPAPGIHVGMTAPVGDGWKQDADVLDTWFSSWLWPFATMVARPEKLASDLKNPSSLIAKFYPTSDLVTGPDIIFFWVARMIMAGFEFMGQKPFANVYFTGIVRDKSGRKMSKSLGNSPDPLDLIAKYGADALRFGLMRCAPLGLDIRFDEQQVELGRNFCNKLWNAARLRLTQTVEGTVPQLKDLTARDLSSDDQAILAHLDAAVRDIAALYDGYEINQVANRLYELFWSRFCDWYLEAAKAGLYGTDARRKAVTLAVMDHVLNTVLRLLHPYMPFVTEELWQALGYQASAAQTASVQFAAWPEGLVEADIQRLGLTSAQEQFAEQKYEAVTAGRNLRASYNIPSNRKARFAMTGEGSWHADAHEVAVLQTLLNAEAIGFVKQAPPHTVSAVTPLGTLYLSLEGLVDVAAETQRLEKQIAKLEKELQSVTAKLADEGFASRAPAEAVAKHRARADQLKADMTKIRDQIAVLGGK